jgi:Mrp family chromosome partitioning ATPase
MELAGAMPEMRKGRWMACGRRRSDVEDAARELRRSLAASRGGSSQAVLITGAVAGDGKSRMAAALAVSLAHSGARVLLVDADLPSPSLHSTFGVEQGTGLAEALTTGGPAEVHVSAESPRLSLVCAGHADLHGNWDAADLLASQHMGEMMQAWRTQYDFVLLHSPPVLPVPDAAALAQLCDRTVLVVQYLSPVLAARRSYKMIARNLKDNAALDVVVNGVPGNYPEYFGYDGHKGISYGQRERLDA